MFVDAYVIVWEKSPYLVQYTIFISWQEISWCTGVSLQAYLLCVYKARLMMMIIIIIIIIMMIINLCRLQVIWLNAYCNVFFSLSADELANLGVDFGECCFTFTTAIALVETPSNENQILRGSTAHCTALVRFGNLIKVSMYMQVK